MALLGGMSATPTLPLRSSHHSRPRIDIGPSIVRSSRTYMAKLLPSALRIGHEPRPMLCTDGAKSTVSAPGWAFAASIWARSEPVAPQPSPVVTVKVFADAVAGSPAANAIVASKASRRRSI